MAVFPAEEETRSSKNNGLRFFNGQNKLAAIVDIVYHDNQLVAIGRAKMSILQA